MSGEGQYNYSQGGGYSGSGYGSYYDPSQVYDPNQAYDPNQSYEPAQTSGGMSIVLFNLPISRYVGQQYGSKPYSSGVSSKDGTSATNYSQFSQYSQYGGQYGYGAQHGQPSGGDECTTTSSWRWLLGPTFKIWATRREWSKFVWCSRYDLEDKGQYGQPPRSMEEHLLLNMEVNKVDTVVVQTMDEVIRTIEAVTIEIEISDDRGSGYGGRGRGDFGGRGRGDYGGGEDEEIMVVEEETMVEEEVEDPHLLQVLLDF